MWRTSLISYVVIFLLIVISSSSKNEPSGRTEYLTLIGTVDGNVHGIDEYFKKVWTTSTGEMMLSGTIAEDNQAETVIPSLDGSLLYYNQLGMRKTSVKARVMTENSPLVSKDGMILTGRKSCRLLGLDLNDGSLLADIAPNKESKLHLPIKSSDKAKLQSGRKIPFWLGRVDYHIQGIDAFTGFDRFNVSYAEFQPLDNRYENHLFDLITAGHSKTNINGDDSFSFDSHEDISLISTPEGTLFFLDKDGELMKDVPITLGSPAINAFIVGISSDELKFIKKLDIKYSLNDIKRLHKIKANTKSLLQSSKKHITSAKEIIPKPAKEPLVLVQSSKSANNEFKYMYAMELEMFEDTGQLQSNDFIGSSLIHSIRSKLDGVGDHPRLPSPSSSITNDQQNIPDSNFPVFQNPTVLSKGLVRRPSPHTVKRIGKSPNWRVMSQNVSTSVAVSDSNSKLELETSHSNSISKIRGLHRLQIGKVNEEFWLEQLSNEVQSKAKHASSETVIMEIDKRTSFQTHIKAAFNTVAGFWITLLIIILSVAVVVIVSIGFLILLSQNFDLAILPRGTAAEQLLFCVNTIFRYISQYERERIREVDGKLEKATTDSDGITRVGSLTVSSKVIGLGSHGTVVYEGLLNGRPVAVKRMLAQFNRAAER